MLFDVTRNVAATGTGVLFVSHDLEEVKQLTDRFTVFRDGRVVGGGATADHTRERDRASHRRPRPRGGVSHRSAAQTRGAEPSRRPMSAARGGLLADASLVVHRGEVLGVTGLSGSGFEDLPYLLFGAAQGRVAARSALRQRIAPRARTRPRRSARAWPWCPADRPRDGAILCLSVLDNVSMQTLDTYQQWTVPAPQADARRGPQGPVVVRRATQRPDPAVLEPLRWQPAEGPDGQVAADPARPCSWSTNPRRASTSAPAKRSFQCCGLRPRKGWPCYARAATTNSWR